MPREHHNGEVMESIVVPEPISFNVERDGGIDYRKKLQETPLVPVSGSEIEDSAIEEPHRVSSTTFAGGQRVLYRYSSDRTKLVSVQTVGKVRVRVRDEKATPLEGVQFTVIALMENEAPMSLAILTTDKMGYGSIDLSHIEADPLLELRLVPITEDSPRESVSFEILHAHMHEGIRDAGLPHELILSEDLLKRIIRVPPGTGTITIDYPDSADIRNSPASFDQSISVEGADCTLSIARNFATRQFFFRQIVREQTPDLQYDFGIHDPDQPYRGLFPRGEIRRAIGFDEDMYAVQAGNPVLGKVNLYRQAWMPMGHSLGELLYSLALAPCEETKIAIIEWSRHEENARREFTAQAEQLQHELFRDREIGEVVQSVLNEMQSGNSWTAQAGGGLNLGFFSIGGGGGYSSSSSEGHRQIQASTIQNLADAIIQRASSYRSLRSTIITQSTQAEREEIRTRTVRNHNVNHALTIEYFEVLKHFRVRTELVEQADVLLIPYEVPAFLYQALPDFQTFQTTGYSLPFLKWLDKHASVLRQMLPSEYAPCFEALRRVLNCGDVYGYTEPFATASRWTVEMNEAWNSDIRLTINTFDGEAVELSTHQEKPGGVVRFTSDPIDLSKVETLEIVYDAPKKLVTKTLPSPTGPLVYTEEVEQEYMLKRIRLIAHTDPSEFLRGTHSYKVGDEPDAAVPIVLKKGANAHVINLRVPKIDFSGYRGQAHRDYCCIKELAALLREDPMKYLRGLWMAEDPDRRALRLDAYLFQGKSLLDQIQNEAVGVVGNLVAFPLLENGQLKRHASMARLIAERHITLPTRGVFAETLLSRCNATEQRDVTRIIDSDTGCNVHAPDITGITPGTRKSDAHLSPAPFASPMIAIQNAPEAPAPKGLTSALELLGRAELFRNMSLGAETVNAVKSLSSEALHEASESERQLVDNASKALNAEAGESLRASNPAKVYDHLQNIELARNMGALTEEDAKTAVRNLLGAPGGDVTGELASLNLPHGNAHNNFHVSGSILKDPNGNPFIMRGVNNPHIWWDTESYNALATIRSYSANSVRIVWETKGRAARLKQILERCKQLKLIAVVELHDVTCKKGESDRNNDPKRLNDMAKYFAREDISTVLKSYSKYTLINIANEWGDHKLTDTAWLDGYKTAITTVRTAGLTNPIIIDSSGCGQNSSPIKKYGKALLEHDPNKNVLFSIHMYGKWNDAGDIGKELNAIKNMGLCVIIGEFGYNYKNGHNNLDCKVDAFEVMKQSNLNDIGYLAWSWSGNDRKNAWLNLAEASDWKTLTEWGDHVFNSEYGIKKTSKLASIF